MAETLPILFTLRHDNATAFAVPDRLAEWTPADVRKLRDQILEAADANQRFRLERADAWQVWNVEVWRQPETDPPPDSTGE